MTALIVGVGLMGGSFANSFRELKIYEKIYGLDKDKNNLKEALRLKIIDEKYSPHNKKEIDLIVLSIPVDCVIEMLPKILDYILPNQIVIDLSSVKFEISKSIDNHRNRKNFVSTHPMWGTEYSGPSAAIKNAFQNKMCVICDKNKSDKSKLKIIEEIYRSFKINLCYMNSKEHDLHTAYISHISHVTSFVLANTVLKKEKKNNKIFQLAGGGFQSTVRLAKSSPDMWTPIFRQNKKNILNVLNENITQLQKFKKYLEQDNFEKIYQYILKANSIKKVIK